MKTKFISAALLAALALLSSSCVTQKKYSQLQDDYDLLMSQFNDAKIALASCETGSKSLEERLAEARANNAKLLEQYQALQASLDKSINQFDRIPWVRHARNISRLIILRAAKLAVLIPPGRIRTAISFVNSYVQRCRPNARTTKSKSDAI